MCASGIACELLAAAGDRFRTLVRDQRGNQHEMD